VANSGITRRGLFVAGGAALAGGATGYVIANAQAGEVENVTQVLVEPAGTNAKV
jgi:hypothetical protein